VLVVLSVVSWAAAADHAAAQDRRKLDRTLQSRAGGSGSSGSSRVIIRLRDGVADAASVVQRVGARAGVRLESVHAQVADVDDAALDALSADPSVLSVHLDRPLVSFHEAAIAPRAGGVTQSAAATAWDGSGIGVAIVDSGVMPHDDLGLRGANGSRPRLTASVDFVNGSTAPYDDFGHGTHVAGIVGGDGTDSAGAYAGTARGAGLVSLKVLDASGRGTISTAIQAIDYAIANRVRLNIRVINLSVGAAVTESFFTDPFTLATWRAVQSGITVVAAAGNLGRDGAGNTQYGGITAPGNAPWVLTVGAYNHMGTLDRGDDAVAAYSSRGPTAVDLLSKPDLVAPGTRIVSLAAAESTLALARPHDLVAGTTAALGLPYLTLSGTSMAAPAVSGPRASTLPPRCLPG
jgi:serine protease AprX